MPKLKNIVGFKYGDLVVIERDNTVNEPHARWFCKCICGKTVSTSGLSLRNNGKTNCGCKHKSIKYFDIGERFGRLTVVKRVDRPAHRKRNGVWWKCKCDCGNTIIAAQGSLKSGGCKSCGCAREEALSKWREIFYTTHHGVSKAEIAFLNFVEEVLSVKVERQFKIKNRFYDGRIGNILLESDCPYWHNDVVDKEKTDLALEAGFMLYRFEINSVRDLNKKKEDLKKELLAICLKP